MCPALYRKLKTLKSSKVKSDYTKMNTKILHGKL